MATEAGLCECGCGEPAPISPYTDRNHYGYRKGEPRRFIRGHQHRRRPISEGRKCMGCGQTKTVDDFPRAAKNTDGRAPYCRDCQAARKRERKERDPDALREQKRKQRERWREKDRISRSLRRAVREGRIEKPDECSRCGCTAELHGHHEDYTKPLEVVWLCPRCHGELHGEMRSISKGES